MEAELWWILCENFQILLPWQQGLSDTNFTYTVKSADLENPLYGQESWWYLLHKLSNGRFSLKFSNFCCHGNKGGSNKIWMTQFDWPTPKPPVRCKNLGPILNASWVMVNFVWKLPNFCCHGNRGRRRTQILLIQLNRPTPKTPYLVQESWWYLGKSPLFFANILHVSLTVPELRLFNLP